MVLRRKEDGDCLVVVNANDDVWNDTQRKAVRDVTRLVSDEMDAILACSAIPLYYPHSVKFVFLSSVVLLTWILFKT